MNILNALIRKLGDKFQKESSPYYSMSNAELLAVAYTDLCCEPKKNIYLMRKFNSPHSMKLFDDQLSQEQRYYRENGYLILRNFIPHDLIDSYQNLRKKLNLGRSGFDVKSRPHMEHQIIRDIACYEPLVEKLRELHSMDMGLIFSLTGFTSTQRGWHQDSYLDADDSTPRCATWISLGDVDEDCGPFEYIPGSNRWPALSNQKINKYMKKEHQWPHGHRRPPSKGPRWGRLAEKFIDPAVDQKIAAEGHSIEQFTAAKGDVLIWYGRLMHRGSKPTSSDALRPALISHYAPLGEKGRGLFLKRKTGGYFLAPEQDLEQLSAHDDIS